MAAYWKVCQHCNATFKGARAARYCSEECHWLHDTRICPVCQTAFIDKNTLKIYCSKKCQAVGNKRKQNAREAKLRTGHYKHDFDPKSNGSFFESEDERRQRLGRKRL